MVSKLLTLYQLLPSSEFDFSKSLELETASLDHRGTVIKLVSQIIIDVNNQFHSH